MLALVVTLFGALQEKRIELPNGNVVHLAGEPGHERLTRVELLAPVQGEVDGGKHFFERKRGRDVRVRSVYPDGEQQFFEGEAGHERRVRVELPDGGVNC